MYGIENTTMTNAETIFDKAFTLLMLSEVGPWFNPNDPATIKGLIDTKEHRKACGYVNHPLDPGGETKFGVAKNSNRNVNITTLDLAGAKKIFFDKYWTSTKSDKMPSPLAALYFDLAVISGQSAASKVLQRALGVVDDGVIGPKTLASLNSHPDLNALSSKYLDCRQTFFNNLVASRPDFRAFQAGWNARITLLRKWLASNTKV